MLLPARGRFWPLYPSRNHHRRASTKTSYGVGLVAAEAEDSVNYDILKKRGAINAPRLKKYDISNGFIL